MLRWLFASILCLVALASSGCGDDPGFRHVDVTYPTRAELRTDLGVPAPKRQEKTLIVGVDAGFCVGVQDHGAGAARVDVEETPDAVLLRAWARYTGKVAREKSDACAGVGGIDLIRVKLSKPLGPRAVVDPRGGMAVRAGSDWFPSSRPVIVLRPIGRERLRRLRKKGYDLGAYARPPWTCSATEQCPHR